MGEEEDEEHSYKPGTIISIKLSNFMCHDSFEISLGPRVNFIIGPNGSGKSALLTALVIALGGRATMTQRAKRLSDFIKTGKDRASILIVIHNYRNIMDKDKAFKPDDYGKTITVYKVITRANVNDLSLKSDKGKKVSERKAELDEMLEHFGILINNPICILNQEVSKTFLHSKKPEDKFDLFMKATDLEQITNDYSESTSMHQQWDECNQSKSTSFKLLESEYNSCKEKTSFLENRAKLNEMREALNGELIWAMTRDNEENVASLEKQIREKNKKIADQEKLIRDRETKISNNEQELLVSQGSANEYQVQVDQAKKDLEDIVKKESTERAKRIDINSDAEIIRRRIARHEEDKCSLEESIADLKQQSDKHDAEAMERTKLDLARLENEIPLERAKERNIRESTRQLDALIMHTREELQKHNSQLNKLRGDLASGQAHLRRLKNGQANTLNRYGDQVVRIRDRIDEYHSKGRFRVKPMGPLGYYLKLKEPMMAPALELHLGKNANAFICDNAQDLRVLNSIIKDVYRANPRGRQPIVITRRFGRKHDVQRFAAYHPRYKTFLDNLEIEEDPVFNALIDRSSLEATLFIPDFYEAENLLLNKSTIPQRTRTAWTKDCYAITPNTDDNYKCFHNNHSRCALFKDDNLVQIRDREKEIQNINSHLREVEKLNQDIQRNYEAHRREKDANDREIASILERVRSKEERLLLLKTTIMKEPQELGSLEEELERNIAFIAKENLTLEKRIEKIKEIDEELKNIKSKLTIRQNIAKEAENKKLEVMKILENQKMAIRNDKKLIREAQTIIETVQREKVELDKNLGEALEKAARLKLTVAQDIEKPSQIRPTDVIKEELRKVDTQLRVDIEEMQDPEEMRLSLIKRMKEIEDQTALKDFNLKNFTSMKKLLEDRDEGLANLRLSTVGSVATTFATVMRTMKMTGELHIYLDDVKEGDIVVKKAKTLEIRVDTNYGSTQRSSATQVMNETNNNRRTSRSQPPPKRLCREANDIEKENDIRMTDTRSLSGGERSFSTVAFVLSLWHHCASPFKLMDEIDVFMDMVTRRVSYNALIRYAQVSKDPGQFIFFSPLELPKFDDHQSFVRVYEMPSIVRKGPVSTQEEV